MSTKTLVKSSSQKLNGANQGSLLADGRSYRIGNSDIPHQLPAPSKLHPHVDIKAGHVDAWPANATNKSTTTKPKFLQNLEVYIQRELRALGCNDDQQPSEKRLQAFREAFQYLIKDFHTCRPILSAIKHEYEAVLKYQQETIKELEPLKGMLVTLNEQCEHKLLHLQQEEKQDIIGLKNENAQLQNVIASLKDEISALNRQVEKCQEEVEIEYRRYRDESDARKLLIQDINDLKYQQEEAKKALGHGENEPGKEEDPVMLRIALGKAREDLQCVKHKLAETLADYGDVVPRRDHEKLDASFKKLEEEFSSLKKDHENLAKEHSALIDVHKKVIEQRDNYATDCERMRQSATPRPTWEKCSLYIEGGGERWQQLSDETSTSEKVDILLSEMTGHDMSVIKVGGTSVIEFFQPKGVDDDVPLYLRSTEQIRNRRLAKRDLTIIIKDVWQEKIKLEGSKPFSKERDAMPDFFYKYLKNRFPAESMVIEWGYNVHDALLRYDYDSNVSMFGAILKGELDEDVYYQQLASLEDLYKFFAKKDLNETGVLKKEEFQDCLATFFSMVTPDEMEGLMKSAENELGEFEDGEVPFRDLFTEDDEGKSGPFITSVLKLTKADREKYMKEIVEYLENHSEVSVDDLRDMFNCIDPKISESTCLKYMHLGIRDENQFNSKTKLGKDLVLQNLRRSCVARSC